MSNVVMEKIGGRVRAPIAQMTEHDLLEVVEIEESSGLSRWGWEAYYGELARPSESVMLVARGGFEDRNAGSFRILGFIAARLTGEDLHINNMAVREGWRQEGIGASLLFSALEEGKRRGAQRSFLEVRTSNTSAQALYQKLGFRESGRRPRYYAQPTEDALVMTRTLS
jgi:[ribosomal protein S18]-alanine N-acetyltransferase